MYEEFARIYDELMEDVPYRAWADYLTGYLKAHGIGEGLVLDLGCGTGTLTRLLSGEGYDMIGADCSDAMLQIAAEKSADAICTGESDILWLQQDMRSFELYGTVRAMVSACDSMNYMLTSDDLLQVFKLANNYLDPGGLFLFDMNTAYKYREILGDKTFAQSLPDCAYIWENSWFEEEKINQYELTLFIRESESGHALYDRYEEIHMQRAWDIDEVKELIGKAGMKFVEVLDAYTGRSVSDTSERVLFVAQEQGKQWID